ncbi:MAG: Na+/H+ antiporter NhaC family protein [Bacteroidota bacterium]
MMPKIPGFILLFLVFTLSVFAQSDSISVTNDTLTTTSDSIEFQKPPTEVKEIKLNRFTVVSDGEELAFDSADAEGMANITINGETFPVEFTDGIATLPYEVGQSKLALFKWGDGVDSGYKLMHFSKRNDGNFRNRHLPLWLSLLPPLLAIFLALVFREVVVSLFTGILAGAFIANGLQFDPIAILRSIWRTIDHYIINALNDSGHLAIIVFSLMIGGMVAIISRNGGMAGVVQKLSKYATTPKSAQFITWLLGVAIFFDDYANTLIVGNTMRSTSDSFKISREKLAYIVDSTAAPIAALAFVTTWIGFELGQIEVGLAGIKDLENPPNAYAVFLSSLKYSFYPILTLIFILFLIFKNRDYGAMLKAETRARVQGIVAPKQGEITEEGDMEDLKPVEGAPLKWYNAALPVFLVIFVTLFGLVETGMAACYDAILETRNIGNYTWGNTWSNLDALSGGNQSGLGVLIGNADSYTALIWASFTGMAVAAVMTVAGGIMKLTDTMNTMIAGFKAMLPAVVILVLAWSLAGVTQELFTADYLTSLLLGSLQPTLIPVVVFILAALISFSTGSSWSTMAILYPIAIPLTWSICTEAGIALDQQWEIMYNVIATVLAASVLGDHCSPISDTTILSSLATDCNHIEHVRTQLPYALTVGVVSIILGYLSTAIQIPIIIHFTLGLGVLFAIVHFVGKPVPESD